MPLRTIFTTEQGVNPPSFGKIPGQDAYYPLIQIDDNGQMYMGGVPFGSPPPSPVTDVSVAITALSSDQFLTLKANPVIVVPSPGSGFALVPISASFQYLPVSVDYTLGSVTNLYIGGAVNPLTLNSLHPIPATILDGSSGPGNVLGLAPASNTIVANQSWFDNQALVITQDGSAELTAGNGNAVVKVYYSVVAL